MDDRTPAAEQDPAPSLLGRVDAVCDRFEAAWRAGQRPPIEDYLGAVPEPERSVLVSELIALDVAWRQRSGEGPEAADYRARFPGIDPSRLRRLVATSPRQGALAPSPSDAESTIGDPARRPRPTHSNDPAAEPASQATPVDELPEAVGGNDGSGNGGDSDATAPGDPELPRGTRVRYFGDFELLRVLGQGGMGVVYKTRQRSLNRLVAVKMIRAGVWAGEDEVRRFKNEAESVANLDHPQIVTIYEVGEHDGHHYFSMKLVDGPSLSEKLGRYAADPRSAATLVAEAARAVHHAHQRGILHRDLKPSNILLDGEGRPHITDFGLARRIEGESDLSVSGSILGTPSYMSPEQASGRRASITTAADVYGLGAVLYALLAGGPPFSGESVVETLERVRERAPESPTVVNPRVDRDLETICLKCLEKDPRRRYDSASGLADDLERWLRGEPILARRSGTWERVWKWSRRRPAAAALVGMSGVALLTLVGLSVALVYQSRLRTAYAEKDAALARELTFLYTTLTINPDGRRIASAGFDQTIKLWDLDAGQQLITLLGHRGIVWSVAFSPDGQWIASADENGLVTLWDGSPVGGGAR